MHQVSRYAVVEGLDAERQLLDRIQQGEGECGLLLWRPHEAALVMPRRMSGWLGSLTPNPHARHWAGRSPCVTAAASRCRNRLRCSM